MKSGTFVMGDISEVDVLNAVPSCEAMESLSISHLFNCGWARCQKIVQMYGDNLITPFKDDIAEIFACGERKKGAKIIADIMEVELQIIYPDYYALPRVTAIKSYVGQPMNKKRAREII